MRLAFLSLTGALLGAGALAATPVVASAAAMVPVSSVLRRATPPIVEAARAGDAAEVRRLLAQKADVNAAAGDGMTALHYAAFHGNAGLAQALLKAKASVTATTRLGDNTPLHVAARHGHGAVVRLLLAAGAKPDVPTSAGATALHLAASAGDTLAIQALVRAKADVNAKETEWGKTPLMFAAANNRGAAVRALLAAGADPAVRTEVVDLSTRTSREQAAARKRNEVMFSMLPQTVKDSILKAQAPAPGAAAAAPARGAAPAAAAGAATTATATSGAPAPAAPAIDARAALRAPPTNYLTAEQIQIAIDSGRAVLAMQEAAGPVVSDTSDGQVAGFEGTVGGMGGFTALHHAVRQGHLAATLALLDGGADINMQTATDSTSPLLLATINGHFDLAMQLIERGADVTLQSTAGLTPLYAAVNTQWSPKSRFPQPQAIQLQKTTHLELMTAVLDRGADINVRLRKNLWFFGFNNCGNANCGLEYLDSTTTFWRAAYAVDVEAMRLLKTRGADHTLPSRRVAPPRGARGGGGGELGGDPLGDGDPSGARGARAAAAPGAPAAAAGAATGGATIDDAARARLAAAMAARNAAPTLDPVTDSAAKAVPPGIGVFPIHAAAGVGYGNGFAGNSHRHAPDGWLPAMRYLVEELGADVNARDNNGHTPLHHAAARGDNEMIKYLVSKGADVKAVSRRGQTTVDMANGPVQRLRPYPETIRLLESMGAKNSNKCVGC
jgi:ankyrin repeat protein